MQSLVQRIRRFCKQEDGLVMTEFLIMLPLLVWTFMALFVYWDAFRTINQAQKAAYSVSDLISRQDDIDMNFVNGMQNVMDYLMNEAPNVRLRITSVQFKESTNQLIVLFSRSPSNKMAALTTADTNVAAFRAKVPTMANMDSVVIVETEVSYDPAFEVGIANHTFDNFIVTRPRYYLRVCLIEQPCPATL